jgi:predicted RNA binding protein YcfA (HicA-like mRNA interferase family)
MLLSRGGGGMKSFSSREIIKILEQDGWFLLGARGDHHYFKHKTKPGKITVPHPEKDVDPKTAKSIFKAAGL